MARVAQVTHVGHVAHMTHVAHVMHLPPPQETEQGAISFSSQKWWLELQLEPSPPQMPQTSTVRLEPIRRSQPSGCVGGEGGSGHQPGQRSEHRSHVSGCCREDIVLESSEVRGQVRAEQGRSGR